MPTPTEIDALLGLAIQGADACYPDNWANATRLVLSRAVYHGVAGLLLEHGHATRNWPPLLLEQIGEAALSRAMWELRHRSVISALLANLAAQDVRSVLLKGTAMAYDLYAAPQLRERGDTDLLIGRDAVAPVRLALIEQGFLRDPADRLPADLRTQENWTLRVSDGTQHSIDLHWSPLNAPCLESALTFDELAGERRLLDRLSPFAFAPRRPFLLLHACLHRALHDCSPYFVGSTTYFGGNRLIWLNDIALLARALTAHEWEQFATEAVDRGFGTTCMAGLTAAENYFGQLVPTEVRHLLEQNGERRMSYFRSRQLGRTVMDVAAVPGLRNKVRYIGARAVPGADFIRSKYPGMHGRPIVQLYGRRLIELLRRRPREPRD